MAKKIKPNANNGVIIFSQYAATATYLYNRLKEETPGLSVMFTTGSVCQNNKGKRSARLQCRRVLFSESPSDLPTAVLLNLPKHYLKELQLFNTVKPKYPLDLVYIYYLTDKGLV